MKMTLADLKTLAKLPLSQWKNIKPELTKGQQKEVEDLRKEVK